MSHRGKDTLAIRKREQRKERNRLRALQETQNFEATMNDRIKITILSDDWDEPQRHIHVGFTFNNKISANVFREILVEKIGEFVV